MFLDPLGPNLVKLSICVAPGHGSVLLQWLCTTLCTSSCQCDLVCWVTPLVRVVGYVLSCPTLRRAPRLDESFVEWVLGAEYAMFCTIKHLLVTSCRRAVYRRKTIRPSSAQYSRRRSKREADQSTEDARDSAYVTCCALLPTC